MNKRYTTNLFMKNWSGDARKKVLCCAHIFGVDEPLLVALAGKRQ